MIHFFTQSRARFIALIAAAGVMCSPIPALALQQTPGSNIEITFCYPHLHVQSEAHRWIDIWGRRHTGLVFPYWDAFLAISFRNLASTPATEVDFGLVARGNLIAIAKDVGRFSTGALIKGDEFSVSRDIFPMGNAVPYCAVLRVIYANGTIWKNPDPPEP